MMRWSPTYERSREEGHASPSPGSLPVQGGLPRLPPDDFADDVLSDMANLTEEDTGVGGTIFISTALGAHGPRVKWYPKAPGRRVPCLVISIGPEPAVRDDFLPPQVSRPTVPKVQEWVRINHEELLKFWNEGETWDRRAVSAFLDGLRPIARETR